MIHSCPCPFLTRQQISWSYFQNIWHMASLSQKLFSFYQEEAWMDYECIGNRVQKNSASFILYFSEIFAIYYVLLTFQRKQHYARGFSNQHKFPFVYFSVPLGLTKRKIRSTCFPTKQRHETCLTCSNNRTWFHWLSTYQHVFTSKYAPEY